MSPDVQSWIVHGLMLLCAIYLCRAAWQTFMTKQSGGCGSCSSGGCGSKTATVGTPASPQVFTLAPPK